MNSDSTYEQYKGYHLIFQETPENKCRGLWIALPLISTPKIPIFRCRLDEDGYGTNDKPILEFERNIANLSIKMHIDNYVATGKFTDSFTGNEIDTR